MFQLAIDQLLWDKDELCECWIAGKSGRSGNYLIAYEDGRRVEYSAAILEDHDREAECKYQILHTKRRHRAKGPKIPV